MEHLIPSFTRVVRKVDPDDPTGEALISSLPELELAALTDPTSLSALDRRRILDFPEPDEQAANTATVASTSTPASASSSSEPRAYRADLLHRAAESPQSLTPAEIDLLKARFWLPATDTDVARAEGRARNAARSALLADGGAANWQKVHARLKAMRGPLYDDGEERAIEGAEWEAHRRLVEGAMGGAVSAAAAPVDSARAKARPWVRRLWEEDLGGHGKEACRWGYVVFVDPRVDDLDDGAHWDEYLSRRDAALLHARGAICCGDDMSAKWKLQKVQDWPVSSDNDGVEVPTDRQFQQLAEHFAKLSEMDADEDEEAPAAKRQMTSRGSDTSVGVVPRKRDGGLEQGILRNVFLFIDKDSVDSVLEGNGSVDDMWVWAVDPSHFKAGARVVHKAQGEDEAGGFPGFLRVRLQQLVNNFYEARRFHAHDLDTYSMDKLWDAARRSRHEAFVSTRDEEVGLWTMSRDVGSALRPAGI